MSSRGMTRHVRISLSQPTARAVGRKSRLGNVSQSLLGREMCLWRSLVCLCEARLQAIGNTSAGMFGTRIKRSVRYEYAQ